MSLGAHLRGVTSPTNIILLSPWETTPTTCREALGIFIRHFSSYHCFLLAFSLLCYLDKAGFFISRALCRLWDGCFCVHKVSISVCYYPLFRCLALLCPLHHVIVPTNQVTKFMSQPYFALSSFCRFRVLRAEMRMCKTCRKAKLGFDCTFGFMVTGFGAGESGGYG
ncbi:hypothetical protein P280DRAFT_2546 [Massarina eburnea CBS 473.64]|uniref:Uncharacterized protein n=1 Tax=Massarina eburnea CBS 473.64 TaxID=1395130 RepID=A0A6A6SF16_9PLEO|nr:hypothetical protein P280DRAFT_2546 [Massarina eburnea CBS 473.64]